MIKTSMASSTTVRRAPAPKPCGICEKTANINWKCDQCNWYLCDPCKKVHVMVDTVTVHTIIDIRTTGALKDIEVGQETGTSFVADNIPCSKHKNMNSMFCQICEQLVCPECIADFHEEHALDPINKICQEKLNTLKDHGVRVSQDLFNCQTKIKELETAENEQSTKYKDIVEQIDEKASELKEAISKYARDLQEKVESARKTREKVFQMKKKQMEEAISALQDEETKLKKAIHSNHAGTIFTATSELTESVPNYSFDAQSSDIIDFTQGETTLKKIVDLFGLLRHKEESIIDFKVLKSYTTDFSFVDTVLTTDDKTALISNPTVKLVRQITTSEKLKTLKEISVKIFDMASTSNNEILMSMFGSPEVKLLKPTGQFQQFMSVSPLFPLAVHVTKSNEVFIGVKDGGENFSLTHNSIRKILTFGMDGKQRRSYEYVGQKQRLFTLPYSIGTYHNGNILTIDRTSKIGGRAVTIGKDGKLKWIYNGNISINTRDTPFNPHDIVITTMGYIIVADNNTNAFHVLSGNGELLTCKVMKDQGISIPNALDIDNTGQLWVGCCADKGKTNAKLHIVKIL